LSAFSRSGASSTISATPSVTVEVIMGCPFGARRARR
jgi:hypothetical protein